MRVYPVTNLSLRTVLLDNVAGRHDPQPHQMGKPKGIMLIITLLQTIVLFDSRCVDQLQLKSSVL